MGPGCRDVNTRDVNTRDVNTKVRHCALEDSWRADLRRKTVRAVREGEDRRRSRLGVSEGIKRAILLLSLREGLEL
jgi:hypothetical protein